MKAMILAAGLGSRMRPLTDTCPKPLLKVGDKTLIDLHLERLEALGVKDIAINIHWLGEKIESHINAVWRKRLNIQLFNEATLLETAGGIRNALSFLNSEDDTPFLLINGDVYTEAPLTSLLENKIDKEIKAHILLCENPEHNTQGDFGIDSTNSKQILATLIAPLSHTYSGIGLYRPSMFKNLPEGKAPLGPMLKELAQSHQLQASTLDGYWLDVGTPSRLETLRNRLA